MKTLGIAVLGLGLLTGSLYAQADAREGRPMRGPAVQEERAAATPQRGPVGMRAALMQRPGQHAEFMAVVWMLQDDDAPRGLRLSEGQEKRIGTIDREFQEAARAHQQRLRDLAQSAREGTGRAQRDATDDGEDAGEAPLRRGPRQLTEEERERLEQMRMEMPRPAEAQRRILAQLNDTQRAFVEEELADRRRAAEAQREAQMREQMRARMREAREGRRMDPAAIEERRAAWRERFGPEWAEQRQRTMGVLQRLQQLSPEQREQVLASLEQELDRLGVPAAEPLDRERFQRFRRGGERDGQRFDRRRPRERGDGERPRRQRQSDGNGRQ